MSKKTHSGPEGQDFTYEDDVFYEGDLSTDVEKLTQQTLEELTGEGSTEVKGYKAIGIRDPVGWNKKKTHFGYNWDPSKPLVVSQSLCTDANARGVIPKNLYGGHRTVSRCKNNLRIRYYRLLVKV